MLPIAIILLACLTNEVLSQVNEICYADETQPYLLLGTKTAYEFVRGTKMNRMVEDDCKPLMIWMLARHGTRYPSEDEIRGMLNLPTYRDNVVSNHEVHKRGSLCQKDIQNLKQWSIEPGLNVTVAKHLTAAGYWEHFNLAKRLQKIYPELLNSSINNVSSENYEFRSTNTNRTVRSMYAFINGLFGSSAGLRPRVVEQREDKLLAPYKQCPAWKAEVLGLRATKRIDEFLQGAELQRLVNRVSTRLGFNRSIGVDQTFLLFQACRQEKARQFDKISPWCAAFTKEDLKLLEYEEDLFCYYYCGHGDLLNRAMGCSPLQDMMQKFEQVVTNGGNSSQPKAVFYFAHDSTVQLHYVNMGLARDEVPLRSYPYRERESRQWRTSLLAPFAANFIAVLHKCGNDSTNPEYKVTFHQSEHPLNIEGCQDKICNWKYIKSVYGAYAENCNIEFCEQ